MRISFSVVSYPTGPTHHDLLTKREMIFFQSNVHFSWQWDVWTSQIKVQFFIIFLKIILFRHCHNKGNNKKIALLNCSPLICNVYKLSFRTKSEIIYNFVIFFVIPVFILKIGMLTPQCILGANGSGFIQKCMVTLLTLDLTLITISTAIQIW